MNSQALIIGLGAFFGAVTILVILAHFKVSGRRK